MKKAFTLVELAIVLVIIGLLTAGVVGGQSLIESARINSILTDISKYKTAIKAFQLEYDALPGDMKDATLYWGKDASACNSDTGTAATDGRQTCNGDGDKTFENLDYSNEPWRAWQQLSNSEIISGKYTGASITGCSNANLCTSPGINTPKSSIGEASWNLFYVDATLSWAGKNQSRNLLALGNPKNLSGVGQTGVWSGLALTAKQMSLLDRKVDDGIPNFGKITNINSKTIVGSFNPNCTALTGSIMSYKLSNTSIACNLYADID